MNDKIESIFQKEKVGIGKRKQAIARVFLVPEQVILLLIIIQAKNTYNIIYHI